MLLWSFWTKRFIKFNWNNLCFNIPFSFQVLLVCLSLLQAIDGKPLIGLGLLGAAALLGGGGIRAGIHVGGGGGYGDGGGYAPQPAPEHHHTTHYHTVEHRPMYVQQPQQYHTYETRTIEYQKWWWSLWRMKWTYVIVLFKKIVFVFGYLKNKYICEWFVTFNYFVRVLPWKF